MKNKKSIVLFLIIFIIVIFFLSIVFAIFNMNNNNIISNVYINSVDMSKKSSTEASHVLKNLIEDKNNSELSFVYSNASQEKYEKTIDLSILNIDYDVDDGLAKALKLGRSGNIIQNNFSILRTLLFKNKITLNFSFDEKMLNTIISDISSNLPDKLVQSGYYIEDENLIITRGKSGYIVDEEKLKENLNAFLNNFSSEENKINIPVKLADPNNLDLEKIHAEIYKKPKDAYFEPKPFKVYAEVVGVNFDLEKAKKYMEEHPNESEYTISLKYSKPKIRLKNLKIDVFPDKLGSFSTRYDETNEARTNNLNLAAKKINGTILSPGEEFSYNKVVGERSIAAGYKEAKVYQGGKIVDGLGGGICQISSTLYNAVVFANLDVTKRFNHQFTTSYVTAGRDATVAYGVKDFKFKNSRTYPIKINVSINSGIAKVDIYGIKEEKEYEIYFDIETVSSIPCDTKYEVDYSLPSGTEEIKQKGSNGIIVNSYKLVKQNGVTLSREFISKDKYNPLDRIILKSSK